MRLWVWFPVVPPTLLTWKIVLVWNSLWKETSSFGELILVVVEKCRLIKVPHLTSPRLLHPLLDICSPLQVAAIIFGLELVLSMLSRFQDNRWTKCLTEWHPRSGTRKGVFLQTTTEPIKINFHMYNTKTYTKECGHLMIQQTSSIANNNNLTSHNFNSFSDEKSIF